MPKLGVRISCSQCVGAAVAVTVEEMLESGWFRRAGAWICNTHRRKGDVDDGSVPFVNPYAVPPAPTTPCGYLITAMKTVESRAEFVAWATDLDGHTRFSIVQEEPRHGLRWVRWAFDEFQAKEVRRSQGCFYDGVPEHPEGALQWAIDCARASWERAKSL